MKQKLSALLACAMLLTSLVGCAPKTPAEPAPQPESPPVSQPETPEKDEPPVEGPIDSRPQVNFTVLSGPTGVGAAKLIADNEAGTTKNNYNMNVAVTSSLAATTFIL